MRLFFIILALLIASTGCSETPDISPTTNIVAQDQIQSNKYEAKQAQEEYLRLQKQRQND